MGIAPCPLPSHSGSMNTQFDQSHDHYSIARFPSSDSTSIYSQPSLPSVPSLTSQFTQSSNTTIHYQCISTLKGHSSYISSLVLAGKLLYSGSSDREIRVWSRDTLSHPIVDDHENLKPSNVVAVSSGAVKTLVVSGNKLMSGHQDHKIRVWQVVEAQFDVHHHQQQQHQRQYKRLATLPTLSDRVTKLIPSKNYVQVRRHKKSTWVHHVDAVSSLAISTDGSILYSVSWDRTLKIWRASDFKCLESINKAHDDAINAIVLSNNGLIFTGSADKKVKVWKRIEGDKKHSLVATLEKHESAVNALAISSDGSTLYSGACDRSIVVWAARDGCSGNGGMVVVGALRGHTKAILCLAVVEDLVFSGSADKSVRIWRRRVDGKYLCLGVLEGHREAVKCLAVAADHHNSTSSSSCFLVYSGSLDCDIRVWRISVPL
ncbi:hypothetical protein Sjap_015970 [Stephania japonica]|uniref:Uncharacterized protein n=1 Tax=Stephania japonica TaxID=461633 RepID=A0AAP0NRW4_9MAGN